MLIEVNVMNNLNKLPGMDLVSETLQGSFYVGAVSNPNPGFYIMEQWRDIEGYEGLYQVSNMGRIKSLSRKYTGKDKILKPHYNHEGYPMTSLSVNKKKKNFKMQRFIANAFIPNPENKPVTNHINGIKADIRAENLEWCTHKENTAHAIRTGLMDNSGENCNFTKLNEFQVRVIRKCDDLTRAELAKIFNISADNIWRIRKRYTWKHI